MNVGGVGSRSARPCGLQRAIGRAVLVTVLAVTAIATTVPAGADEPPMPPLHPPPAAPAEMPPGLSSTEDYGAVNGIDTSRWQHTNNAPLDWGAVRNAGMSFAIMKATEGSSTTDPWFARDYAAAGAAGLYRGAYTFARPSLPVSSAATDADYFVRVAGRFDSPVDLPPVLDMEDAGGLTAAQLADWIDVWVTEVQRLTGRDPTIYTGYYFWQDHVGSTTRFSSLPLWYARYNTATQPGPLFGGWAGWTMWQWSSTGSVAGIDGAVDQDKFGGSAADLAALAARRIPARKPAQVTAARNTDGRLEAFVWHDDGSVAHAWQEPSRSGGWSAEQPLVTGLAAVPSLSTNTDGRLEAFAITKAGVLVHSYQTPAAANGWSAWAPVSSAATDFAPETPAVARNADGRLEVFMRRKDSNGAHAWQDPRSPSGWSGVALLPVQVRGPFTAARAADGGLMLAAQGPAGTFGRVVQMPSAPSGWSGWADSGEAMASSGPVMALDAADRLAAFFQAPSLDLRRTAEAAPNGPWASSVSVGPADPGRSVLVANADGRLEVFLRATVGVVAHLWQTSPGGSWSGVAFGSQTTGSGLGAGTNTDGRLETFSTVSDTDDRVIHSWQTPASPSGWSAWQLL